MTTAVQYAFSVERFWSVDGAPVSESISLVYSPNDSRAIQLPSKIWELHRPEIQRILSEIIEISGIDPEGDAVTDVSNGWVIELRVITASRADGLDPIFGHNASNPFEANPISGVKSIGLDDFNLMMSKIDGENVSAAESSHAEIASNHNDRFMTLSKAFGEDVAMAMLGHGIVTREEIAAIQSGSLA